MKDTLRRQTLQCRHHLQFMPVLRKICHPSVVALLYVLSLLIILIVLVTLTVVGWFSQMFQGFLHWFKADEMIQMIWSALSEKRKKPAYFVTPYWKLEWKWSRKSYTASAKLNCPKRNGTVRYLAVSTDTLEPVHLTLRRVAGVLAEKYIYYKILLANPQHRDCVITTKRLKQIKNKDKQEQKLTNNETLRQINVWTAVHFGLWSPGQTPSLAIILFDPWLHELDQYFFSFWRKNNNFRRRVPPEWIASRDCYC